MKTYLSILSALLLATPLLAATSPNSGLRPLSISRDNVDISWWNPDKTGATDVQPTLVSAVAWVNEGGTIYVPPGTYLLSSTLLISDKGFTLKGAGPDTIILATNGADIRLSNTVSATYALNANAVFGATNATLTTDQGTNWAAGDVGFLWDAQTYTPSTPSITTNMEMVTVAGVSGDSVLFNEQVLRNRGYLTASNAVLAKTSKHKWDLKDFTFKTADTNASQIVVYYAMDSDFDNVTFDTLNNSAGILYWFSRDCHIRHSRMVRSDYRGTPSHGYGWYFSGCVSCTAEDTYLDGGNEAGFSAGSAYCQAIRCKVRGGGAMDLHGQGENHIEFIDCTVEGSYASPFYSQSNNGGTVWDISFINCTAVNPAVAGFFINGTGLAQTNYTFRGCRVLGGGWNNSSGYAAFRMVTVNGTLIYENCTVDGFAGPAWDTAGVGTVLMYNNRHLNAAGASLQIGTQTTLLVDGLYSDYSGGTNILHLAGGGGTAFSFRNLRLPIGTLSGTHLFTKPLVMDGIFNGVHTDGSVTYDSTGTTNTVYWGDGAARTVLARPATALVGLNFSNDTGGMKAPLGAKVRVVDTFNANSVVVLVNGTAVCTLSANGEWCDLTATSSGSWQFSGSGTAAAAP